MNRRELLLTSLGIAVLPLDSAFARREGNKWALLIGIDAYQGNGITPLLGAVADADALGKTLIEAAGFPARNVTVLTTKGAKKPTREEIVDQLDSLAAKVRPGDTVVVFYAGHGCQDTAGDKESVYLLPMNARATSVRVLKSTGLLQSEFCDYLRRLPASLLLLVFDMCRVEVGRDGRTELTEEIQRGGFDFSTAQPGVPTNDLPQAVVKWWSCAPGQRAYEMMRERRGYFSYVLEKGLRGAAGKGGVVTLANLTEWVNPEVARAVRATENRAQTPRLLFDGLEKPSDLDRFVLATARAAPVSKPVVVTPKPNPQPVVVTPTKTAQTATLKIVGTLPKSVIFVNGAKITGTTFTKTLLAALTVSVVVKTPGYGDAKSSGTLTPGTETSVAFSFVAQPATPKKNPAPSGKPVSVKPSRAGGRAKFTSAASRIRTQYPALASYLEEMCPIPGGTMDGKSVRGFFLGSTPVTWEVWDEYQAIHDGKSERPGFSSPDHPVVNVSALECEEFCKWLSSVIGLKFRLPDVVEFEYAAREGGKKRKHPWGDGFDNTRLWCSFAQMRSGTASVNRRVNVFRNEFGLSDLVGNVWQWSSTRDGSGRYLTGGSWGGESGLFFCDSRDWRSPSYRSNDAGFRLHAGPS